MKTKILLISIGVALVIAGGAFYGGMKHGESARQNFIRQSFNGQAGLQTGFGNRNGGQSGAGFVSGEIISKDNQSITLQLRQGGSKIVFYSDATDISKFAGGTPTDLETGKTVMVTGNANSDGSITAQSIQIRPEQQSGQ
jgi:hypothetical protein